MAEKTMKISVLRYRPETDSEPHFQDFDVPFHHETSLLEALNYIKDFLAPDLSFRWSCRMAVCGSCGMMINGVPGLACQTFLRDYDETQTMKIEPLANFPIERDLVVDISDMIEKIERIKPYIIPSEKDAHKPLTESYIQTPQQMEKYRQFAMCINCGCCYAACPQYGINPEPVAIAYCIGASMAFATPVATTTVTMVQIAGYRFKDYLRVGGLIGLIGVVAAWTVIVLMYGLY